MSVKKMLKMHCLKSEKTYSQTLEAVICMHRGAVSLHSRQRQ